MDCELLSPWAKQHKGPPPPICAKVGVNGGVGGAGGCPPEMLSLVDVISCILVNPGDGQLEMGNTLVSSDSQPIT